MSRSSSSVSVSRAIRSWKSTITAASPGSAGRTWSSPSAKRRGLPITESVEQTLLDVAVERLVPQPPPGPHHRDDLAVEAPAGGASGQMLVEPLRAVAAQPAVEVLGEVGQHLAAVEAGDQPFILHASPPGARRAAAGGRGAGACARRRRRAR